MNAAAPAAAQRLVPGGRNAADIGLWVFMLMVSSLFGLFLAAYVMRMAERDWVPIALPWQAWLSTVLLAGGSLELARAARAARGFRMAQARRHFAIGGAFALAFLLSQLWGWSSLLAMRVAPAGNPSASFFFLLTAMHGLHVAGGLVAWAMGWRAASGRDDPVDAALRIALTARYWHFLLAIWVALLAAMLLLTPELARAICGVAR